MVHPAASAPKSTATEETRKEHGKRFVLDPCSISGCFGCVGACLLGFLFTGFLGCAHPQQTRMQKPDENEKDKTSEVKTIRDVASFANTDSVQVSGVGIVAGLEGTGGDPPPGGYRDMLLNDLRKRGRSEERRVGKEGRNRGSQEQ